MNMHNVLQNFINELDSIGFNNGYTPVSGCQCVDVVVNHLDNLKALLVATAPKPPKKSYVLRLLIDTDDDAKVLFEGKEYCFYGEDLNITRRFDSIPLASQFIDSEIEVVDGGKASRYVKQWLSYISFAMIYDIDFTEDNRSGNQTLSFTINEELL